MKELTIEEKARRYDEALERYKAKQEYESQKVHEFIEYLFPELKESEDEKIRKALVELISTYLRGNENGKIHNVYAKDILAWLEKQADHAKFRESIQIGDKVTRNQDGVLVNLSQLKRMAKPAENKGKHNMGISEATKQELEDNLNKALEKETPESCNEFLEKQGEKKSYASETMNEKRDFDSGFTRMMEKEQKSADKVEPNLLTIERAKEMSPFMKSGFENESATWSEDDEKILNLIIARLHSHPNVEAEEYGKDYHWLKSLKDRIKGE